MFLYAKRFSICSFQMHDATFKSIILCENAIKSLIATLVSLETIEDCLERSWCSVRLLSRYIHTRSLEIREMKRLATRSSFNTTGNDYCFSAGIDVKHIGGYYRVFFDYLETPVPKGSDILFWTSFSKHHDKNTKYLEISFNMQPTEMCTTARKKLWRIVGKEFSHLI